MGNFDIIWLERQDKLVARGPNRPTAVFSLDVEVNKQHYFWAGNFISDDNNMRL